MKSFSLLILLSCFLNVSLFAQEKTITHKVQKGETVTQIAQKYQVSPYDIYQLNPDAQLGVTPNTLLLIPKKGMVVTKVSKPTVKTNGKLKTHVVAPKETLFGIQNKYQVTEEALLKANPFLVNGLQAGQTLTIPVVDSTKVITLVTPKVETTVLHAVKAQETKYSIAKQYQITIEALEKKNPEIVPGLQEGMQLVIKGSRPKTVVGAATATVKSPASVSNEMVKDTIKWKNYTVQAKETLYSLTKMSGLTTQELIRYNPILKDGVQEGMVLRLPISSKFHNVPSESKPLLQLQQKKSGAGKILVLLMPFNLNKVANDTVNSIGERLKKDKFLNMTLDFYSGASMAIDSAKQLGIKVDVAIFDSKETRNTSQVPELIREGKLANADVVIGPFYQNNVEKTAELLEASKVAVISPLSKETGLAKPNLYQSIVSSETVKTAIFDYMKSKNGNMIAVVDKKKESARSYFNQYQQQVKIAPLTATGGVNTEALKSLLDTQKINYVILETGNTLMIKSTIATLLQMKKTHKVQLVILEPNPTLDTDEIAFSNLIKLNLLYPSATRENMSEEARIFEKKYREINKISPSVYATRGFDLVFDTLLRMTQEVGFAQTLEESATEQVQNKFVYAKRADGGMQNKGAYILYYDEDMNIKEAN